MCGRWSKCLAIDISAAVCTWLARPLSAVIVNLHQLADPAGASIPLWPAIRRAALAQQPPVQLVLCLPASAIQDRHLRRSGAGWHPPMFATMSEAGAAVTAPQSPVEPRKAWRLTLPAPRRR